MQKSQMLIIAGMTPNPKLGWSFRLGDTKQYKHHWFSMFFSTPCKKNHWRSREGAFTFSRVFISNAIYIILRKEALPSRGDKEGYQLLKMVPHSSKLSQVLLVDICFLLRSIRDWLLSDWLIVRSTFLNSFSGTGYLVG